VAHGLGLRALAWGLVRSKRKRILFAGVAVALLVVVRASPMALRMTRFLTRVPVLLCLAFGEAMEVLGPPTRLGHWAFTRLFLVSWTLNVVMTLNDGVVLPDDFRLLLGRPAQQRYACAVPVTVPPEYGMTLGLVPGDRLLGHNVHGNGFSYPPKRADYSQRLAYIPIPEGCTCTSIADAVDAHSTHRLFVAAEHTEDSIPGLLNTCANEQDVLRERVRRLAGDKRGYASRGLDSAGGDAGGHGLARPAAT